MTSVAVHALLKLLQCPATSYTCYVHRSFFYVQGRTSSLLLLTFTSHFTKRETKCNMSGARILRGTKWRLCCY